MSKLHEFTEAWWTRLVKRDGVVEWLQRIYTAEISGGFRFMNLATEFTGDIREYDTLRNFALDEFKHAQMVATVLETIHVTPSFEHTLNRSERYWDAVNEGAVDRWCALAAGAYGKVLALNRFRVVSVHPDTPPNVKVLVDSILPDEARHAENLATFAGQRAMEAVRPFHRNGMKAFGLPVE